VSVVSVLYPKVTDIVVAVVVIGGTLEPVTVTVEPIPPVEGELEIEAVGAVTLNRLEAGINGVALLRISAHTEYC